MADATTRQIDSRAGRPERTSRSLQEDRLVTASKDRERKAKTRLDPTPMAHAQHNRKNPELEKRMKLTEEALSESATSEISSALN